MINPLRKRHFQAWCLLALLLPAGFFASLSVRPGIAQGEILQPDTDTALPVVLQESRKKNYTVRIRSNSSSGAPLQLEWVNTEVLPFPTAVIYRAAPGITETGKSQLVGRIEARGSYRFPLADGKETNLHFFLYDFIKEELLDTIDFSIQPKPQDLP